MNIHRIVALGATCALVAALAVAQTRTYRFKLGSSNYHYKEKRLNNHGVRLIRRSSKAPCIQGRSWGYNSSKIWVDKGCVAEFSASIGNYGGNRPVRPPIGRPPIGRPPVRPPHKPPIHPPHGGPHRPPSHGKPPVKPPHGKPPHGKPPHKDDHGKPPHKD